MNRLTIIGNLTNDPQIRTTTSGESVCNFTVAVNRRSRGQQEADFFRVSAWRQTAENCHKYLSKGKKVCVIGPVSGRAYQTDSGETRVSLEVTANDVEFLSPANENNQARPEPQTVIQQEAPKDPQTGFSQVEMDDDELPF